MFLTRLSSHLQKLIGKRIALGRGGPGGNNGYLIGVGEDYLSLYASDGRVMHCALEHVKSITERAGEDQDTAALQDIPVEELASLPGTFWELLRSCQGKKIQVYDHGPETASGFLFACEPDYVTLVVTPTEVSHYSTFHIRSVCLEGQRKQVAREKGEKGGNESDNRQQQEQGGGEKGGGEKGGSTRGEAGRGENPAHQHGSKDRGNPGKPRETEETEVSPELRKFLNQLSEAWKAEAEEQGDPESKPEKRETGTAGKKVHHSW